MPYNNNVPLANQSIASTQVPINNNFAFIQTDLRVDHVFNGNTPGAEGTHHQCQMAGQGSPPSLLAGSLGAYYVDLQSNPQYLNSSDNKTYNLALWREINSGTVSLNTATGTTVYTNTSGTDLFGLVYITGPINVALTSSNFVASQIQFMSITLPAVFGRVDLINDLVQSQQVTVNSAALTNQLQVKLNSPYPNGDYRFLVMVRSL